MIPIITTTFLELGDATSRNLAFSHRGNVLVSYGEETITESNLLEIRRRHPEHVYIRTFTKAEEALKRRRLGMAYYRPEADRKNAGPGDAYTM